MAKKKTVEDDWEDIFSSIAANTGGQVFKNTAKVKYFIDTGNLALNYASSGQFITGGIPGGKITEIYGPPATSKSLLGYAMLAGVQRMGGFAIYLDCEMAGNADFAQSAGHVDVARLLSYELYSIEQVEAKMLTVIKFIRAKYPDKPILFVWDSIGASPTEREWSENELPENFTKEQFKKIVGSQERPGERARAAGDLLRKLNPFLKMNDVTLMVINQVRQKIGVLYGDPESRSGGKALEYFGSCRFRTSAHKMIEDKKLKVPVGVNLKFVNKKNRSRAPGMKLEDVRLFFNEGIDPLGGLLYALLVAERIEGGKGNYRVKEPWAEGKEVKFKASVTRNDVPMEVLLECPSLIDAESKEQVEKYLSIFMGAINLSRGSAIEEKAADGDDDEDIDMDAIDHLGLGDDVAEED